MRNKPEGNGNFTMSHPNLHPSGLFLQKKSTLLGAEGPLARERPC